MKILFLILVSLLFSSCSLFMHEGPKKELNKMTFHELKNHYKKTETLAGKTFHATLIPMIPSFMRKDYKQMGSDLNLSLMEIQNKFKKEMDLINQGLTCFRADLKIERPNSQKAAQFKNWVAEIEDSKGHQYFLEWHPDTLMTNPSRGETRTYHGKSITWVNQGIGCIRTRLDIEEGLKLTMNLDKEFVPWPFGSQVIINWPAHQFKVVKGKKVYQEPVKKVKFNYRGW